MSNMRGWVIYGKVRFLLFLISEDRWAGFGILYISL